ncbi:hypothetical protein FQN53_000693 [Emmonsiellopsis sp. PD_33]|nr:hypothetical protein FQN53_000693 [Emmonsiellopsis sp. PD_33]
MEQCPSVQFHNTVAEGRICLESSFFVSNKPPGKFRCNNEENKEEEVLAKGILYFTDSLHPKCRRALPNFAMGNLDIVLLGESEKYRKDYEALREVAKASFPEERGYKTSFRSLPETDGKTWPTYKQQEQDLPLIVVKFRDHEILWIRCGGLPCLQRHIFIATPYPPFAIAADKNTFECYKVEQMPDYGGRWLLFKHRPDTFAHKINFKAERSGEAEEYLTKFIALVEEEKERLEASSTA